MASRTDAAGLTVTYTYNALDQVLAINYPNNTKIEYLYDSANGQLLRAVTDRAGNLTQYQYDARFAKIKETAGNGAITQYQYDALGRLSKQIDGLSQTTQWTYDAFDQVTQMTYPDSTPQAPRIAQYQYDSYGKLLGQSGTGQYPVTYQYDTTGNRIALIDGNNAKTQWSYDPLNRVTAKTYADGSKYNYSYDAAGNLVSRKDALGRTTSYTYNDYNLVAQVKYPQDQAVTFTYDTLGRRTRMVDGSGTTNWAWDAAGRNLGSTQGAIGQGVVYSYDDESRRATMDVGPINGTSIWNTTYGYDHAGRLKTLADERVWKTNPVTYRYQAGTNWIANRNNADGSSVTQQYDILGRLTTISAADPAGKQINTYGYKYDAAGQRTEETSSIGKRQFSYDNLRQLTAAYRADGSGQPLPNYNYSYTFDPIGNWTKATANGSTTDFTPNNLNQYVAILQAGIRNTPQNDANGNLLSDGQGNTYKYDEENRLIEANTPGQSIAKVVSVYDGLSRRVEKRNYNSTGTLTGTTRYLYDGLLPIAEYDASNTLINTLSRGLDLSGTLQGAGGIGGLLALTNTDGSFSYFTDGNGNVTDLTDAFGTSAAHYEYDPFGNLVSSTGTLQQSYQWSSKENDGNGLVYYLYRFYNPSLGRWVNRDRIGEKGGINLYGFVEDDVINIVDCYGNQGKKNAPPNSPKKSCSCECPKSISLVDVVNITPSSMRNQPVTGHSFNVKIDLEYIPSLKPQDATLSWIKNASRVPQDASNAFQEKANQPYDQYPLHEEYNKTHGTSYQPGDTFEPWASRKKPCPGNNTILLPDTPLIILSQGDRVLHITVTVTAAKGCPCKTKSMTLTVRQKLFKYDSENPILESPDPDAKEK